MLGGDSFCMDDCLGMEDPLGKDVFPIHFNLDALGGKFSVLSLQLLKDKQHFRGEDCNIPKFACSKLEY